jgi:hypothetical protein
MPTRPERDIVHLHDPLSVEVPLVDSPARKIKDRVLGDVPPAMVDEIALVTNPPVVG